MIVFPCLLKTSIQLCVPDVVIYVRIFVPWHLFDVVQVCFLLTIPEKSVDTRVILSIFQNINSHTHLQSGSQLNNFNWH